MHKNLKTHTPSLVPRFRENIGTPLSVATAMIRTDISILCSCYLLSFYIDVIEFYNFRKLYKLEKTKSSTTAPPHCDVALYFLTVKAIYYYTKS